MLARWQEGGTWCRERGGASAPMSGGRAGVRRAGCSGAPWQSALAALWAVFSLCYAGILWGVLSRDRWVTAGAAHFGIYRQQLLCSTQRPSSQ